MFNSPIVCFSSASCIREIKQELPTLTTETSQHFSETLLAPLEPASNPNTQKSVISPFFFFHSVQEKSEKWSEWNTMCREKDSRFLSREREGAEAKKFMSRRRNL